MENPLKSLKIDYWYKACTALGAVITLAAVIAKVNLGNNLTAFSIGSGLFLLGVGEWINHPLQTGFFRQPGVYTTVSGHPRNNSPGGCITALIGIALIACGIVGTVYVEFNNVPKIPEPVVVLSK